MPLQARAATAARWTGLSSVINAVSDTVRTVVLAHFLAPSDYGLMAMVWIVIGFAQMYLDLGISAAIIHRQETSRHQLSSLYWLNIFAGIVMFATIWICSPWIPILFRQPRLQPLLQATALIFLIAPIGSQFEILLQKELSFKALATWEIFASVANTGVALACAVAGFGVWTLVCSFLAGITIKTLLLARVGFRRFRPSFHFKRSDLRGYIGFGLFQMGERSINYLAERLDQILIGPLLGVEALGYYNFALYLTAQPISRINPILTKVAFPLFSKVQNDHDKLRRGYLKLVGILANVNAPLLVGLAAVAPWAIPVVFGAKWSLSIVLVQILSFVSYSRSVGNPIGSLQLAKGRADLGFWWNLFLFACSLPATYAGAKLGGATGVAVALLVLHLCINVPAYLLLVRPLIGKSGRDYIRVTLQPVAIASAMGILVISMPQIFRGMSDRIGLIFQVMTGALVYVSLLRIVNRAAIAEFRTLVFSR